MNDTRSIRLRLPAILRWCSTAVLLALLAWFLDTGKLIDELSRFSLPAVVLALGVSFVQVVLSAWRWRFTARRLGLALGLKTAVREYYLASFLNQCLPGGVLGDVNRALRHGSGTGVRGAAVHAVMIERLSGQLVMFAVAITAGIWLAFMYPQFRLTGGQWGGGYWPGLLILGVPVVLLLGFGGRFWRRLRDYFITLGRDLYRGLLNARVFPVQVASSLLVVASYLGVFWLLSASAYGNQGLLQTFTLLALCSLLLLAMVIPLTVAGWGVREGAAALIWPLAGLPAEQGVALSVGYGLTVLLSSLPGSLFVFSRPAVAD